MTKTKVIPVIGIDGNEANVTNRVGSNFFAFNLLKALEQRWRDNPDWQVKVFLKRAPLSDWPAARPGWEYEVDRGLPWWTFWRLPWLLWQHSEVKLFFSPGHYLPPLIKQKTINSVMDLAYEYFPTQFKSRDLWQLKIFTRLAVWQAKRIVAISESTKRDLIRTYRAAESKISVIYPGVDEVEAVSAEMVSRVLKHLQITKPYLLFVGTLQPRKNLINLLQAFEILRDQGEDLDLVIAGKIGWQAQPIVDAITNHRYQTDIKWLDYVCDEHKFALLAGAEMLILPGLYEGFGIPPVEAVVLGTLPVVSDVSSLPEVVPIKELRFDPGDAQDMANRIKEVWHASPSLKKEWLTKLKSHTDRFSWEAAAKQLEKLFQEAL